MKFGLFQFSANKNFGTKYETWILLIKSEKYIK